MATISKIIGTSDPTLMAQVAETARPQQNAAPEAILATETASKANNPPRQSAVNTSELLDPERIKEVAAKLQESMDRVAQGQHQVGFHVDPETETFVIEIRNSDGSVVKQFPPEKVLNLMRKLDDLSGMVIDEMT